MVHQAWKCSKEIDLDIVHFRYKETPSEAEEVLLKDKFGVTTTDFQDGHIADESMNIIFTEFSKEAKLTKRRGSAYNNGI